MTTGAIIILEAFIALFIVFGIYAGYHREDDQPKNKHHKHS